MTYSKTTIIIKQKKPVSKDEYDKVLTDHRISGASHCTLMKIEIKASV